MFKKILIANRGEIACRVAATARRMGVRTVAVYSDADANARHVHACDEAVHIGGSAPRESYLRWERILEAAKATGAQAVHPGYGFLSENPALARACAKTSASGSTALIRRASSARAAVNGSASITSSAAWTWPIMRGSSRLDAYSGQMPMLTNGR